MYSVGCSHFSFICHIEDVSHSHLTIRFKEHLRCSFVVTIVIIVPTYWLMLSKSVHSLLFGGSNPNGPHSPEVDFLPFYLDYKMTANLFSAQNKRQAENKRSPKKHKLAKYSVKMSWIYCMAPYNAQYIQSYTGMYTVQYIS